MALFALFDFEMSALLQLWQPPHVPMVNSIALFLMMAIILVIMGSSVSVVAVNCPIIGENTYKRLKSPLAPYTIFPDIPR
jgi:hypothetical protein